MTILHIVGEWLRESFRMIPMPVVRMIFLGILVAILAWTLLLPRRVTCPDDDKAPLTQNLKLWASAAIVLQIIIYAIF